MHACRIPRLTEIYMPEGHSRFGEKEPGGFCKFICMSVDS